MGTPTPDIIKVLHDNQVFVFGSNEAGRHGRGAAFTAKKWGARNGIGYGHEGQTFAIPTKDAKIKTLPISSIRKYVLDFSEYAVANPDLDFLVTRIGCGLAGYKPIHIAPLFALCMHLPNVHLPQDFIDALYMH